MAIFSNQATLVYNGGTANSNIAYGEILEVLSATKTALGGTYTPGEPVTYVITVRNTGTGAFTGLTVTDDLGQGAGTTVPLTFDGTSVLYSINGVPQTTPVFTAGPPLTFTGISVPAGGSAVIVYRAIPNDFASPDQTGTLTNTVTVTGGGLTAPVTADSTITADVGPNLAISKAITPAQVADNGRVTYTFLVSNAGNVGVETTDNASVTDTFDPILTDLTVTLNGTVLAEGTDYTYNAVTGQFVTVPGRITVPAATFTQDPTTGRFTRTPGIANLTVTGTI